MFQKSKLVWGAADLEMIGALPFSFVAAATTNATLIKSGQGVITSMHLTNVNAAVRYIKFYDINQKPTAGQGIPYRRYGIPGATTGAGFVFTPTCPLQFFSGIAFVLVTGSGDTDATAVSSGDIIGTIDYL